MSTFFKMVIEESSLCPFVGTNVMRFDETGFSASNFVVSKLFRTIVGVDELDPVLSEASNEADSVSVVMNFVAENAGCFWLLLASATTADSER